MPRNVDYVEVEHLLERGATLVEVLPRREYDEEHIRGAISISLTHLTVDAVAGIERNRPVVVYCYDRQ